MTKNTSLKVIIVGSAGGAGWVLKPEHDLTRVLAGPFCNYLLAYVLASKITTMNDGSKMSEPIAIKLREMFPDYPDGEIENTASVISDVLKATVVEFERLPITRSMLAEAKAWANNRLRWAKALNLTALDVTIGLDCDGDGLIVELTTPAD